MLKKLLIVATLAAGLISTQAGAAFVSTDWKVAGDKGAVLDEDTGLEWLKLNFTHGMSLGEVTEKLKSDLAGWRFPTATEVREVMRNSLPNHTYLDFGTSSGGLVESRSQGKSATRQNEINNWRTLFGTTSLLRSYGFYLHEDRAYNAGVMISTFSTDYFAVYHTDGGVASLNNNVMNGSSIHGFWLVSDGGTTLSSINDPTLNINNPNAPVNMADVSTPAGLAAAGLMAFMLSFRRKKGIGYV